MSEALRLAVVQTRAYALADARAAAAHVLAMVDTALAARPRPRLLLLPECAYPASLLTGIVGLTVDEWLRTNGAPTTGEFVAALAERARRGKAWIAAGLPVSGAGVDPVRAMILISPAGETAALATAGQPGETVDIDGISAGMIVGTDGRLPEIPRMLGLAGAHLLLHSGGWPALVHDPVCAPAADDYMVQVRALENGAWFASANKVGLEGTTTFFTGRSRVAATDGTVVVEASGTDADIAFADITPIGAATRLDRTVQRQAHLYGLLLSSPVVSRTPPSPPFLVGVLQCGPDVGTATTTVTSLSQQMAGLIVLPHIPDVSLDELQRLSAAVPSVLVGSANVACGDNVQLVAWVLHRGAVLGRYAKVHLTDEEKAAGFVPGPGDFPVVPTPVGPVGLMLGEEGLVPEVARILSLQGAEVIAWPGARPVPLQAAVAQTRAGENRTMVAASAWPEAERGTLIVDPVGNVVAQAQPELTQAVVGLAHSSLAHWKTVRPWSGALSARRPLQYHPLLVQ